METAPNERGDVVQLEQSLTVRAEHQISSGHCTKRRGLARASIAWVQTKSLVGTRDQLTIDAEMSCVPGEKPRRNDVRIRMEPSAPASVAGTLQIESYLVVSCLPLGDPSPPPLPKPLLPFPPDSAMAWDVSDVDSKNATAGGVTMANRPQRAKKSLLSSDVVRRRRSVSDIL
jgi:hypothetical protein